MKKIILLIFLVAMLAPSAFAYKTYIGITLTSVSDPNLFYTPKTTIQIPEIGYDKPANKDVNNGDNFWKEGETVYTDAVELTEGEEYTVKIISEDYVSVNPNPNSISKCWISLPDKDKEFDCYYPRCTQDEAQKACSKYGRSLSSYKCSSKKDFICGNYNGDECDTREYYITSLTCTNGKTYNFEFKFIA